MNKLMKKCLALFMSFAMLLATVAVNGVATYAVVFTSVEISQSELTSEGGTVTVTVNAWDFQADGDTVYYEVSGKPADDITAPSETLISRTAFPISAENKTFNVQLPANSTSSDIVYSVKLYSSETAANAEKTGKCTVKAAGSGETPSTDEVYSDAKIFRAKVVDSEGNPVKGIEFKAVSKDYAEYGFDEPSGTTDAEGILEINVGSYMADGRYDVSMVANDNYTYEGDSHYFTMDGNGRNIVNVDGGSISSTAVKYILAGGPVGGPDTDDVSYTAADFDYVDQDFTLNGRTGGSVTLTIHCVKGLNDSGLAKLEKNKNLVIPSEDTEGKAVYGIANNAFYSSSNPLGIESLTLPETAKVSANDFTIGIKAEGVTQRGNFFIGSSAFMKNELTEVEIPEGVIYISSNAFKNNKLTKVTLPSTIYQVGMMAFAGAASATTTNLITDLKLPASTDFGMELDVQVFACNRIAEALLPSNIDYMSCTSFMNNFYNPTDKSFQVVKLYKAGAIDGSGCERLGYIGHDSASDNATISKNNKYQTLESISEVFADAYNRVNELNKTIADLNKQIEALEKQVADLETSNPDQTETINNLNAQIAELQEQVDGLNNTVSGLNNQITELESSVTAQTETINNLNAQIAELQEQVDGLNSTVADLNKQIETLKSESADKDNQIEALNKEILKLKLDGVYLMPAAKAVKYNRVELTWNANENADHYIVYVQEGSGEWTKAEAEPAADVTSMSFDKLKTGTKYSYKVVAVKGDVEGSDSIVAAATPKLGKAAAPKVTGATKAVKASWKSVSGASGYQLSVSTTKKGTKVVKTGNVRKYTKKSLKAKKTYYVKVRAYRTVDGDKKYGSWSTVKSVKTK